MIQSDGRLVMLLLGYVGNCFQLHECLKAEIVILNPLLGVLQRKWPVRHFYPCAGLKVLSDQLARSLMAFSTNIARYSFWNGC